MGAQHNKPKAITGGRVANIRLVQTAFRITLHHITLHTGTPPASVCSCPGKSAREKKL
jgi:hypothetical protein